MSNSEQMLCSNTLFFFFFFVKKLFFRLNDIFIHPRNSFDQDQTHREPVVFYRRRLNASRPLLIVDTLHAPAHKDVSG